MTILELREKRAKAWKPRKPFWILTETIRASCPPRMTPPTTRMEQEITDLGKEIARLETPGGAGGGTEPPGEQAPDGQTYERQGGY